MASFAIGRKAWALAQDQYPTTHPIVADSPDIPAAKNNFDGITYAKGAAVLKQLVAWVGEETFYKGVRLYFQRFANSSTGLEDLLGALEEASGEDLGKWKDAWLLTTGPSTLSLSWASDGAGRLTGLHMHQEGLARPHSLGVSFWTANNGVLREKCHLRVRVEEADSTLEVPPELTETGSAQDIDLVVVNDLDLTYAISRFDEHSMRTALAYVSTIDVLLLALSFGPISLVRFAAVNWIHATTFTQRLPIWLRKAKMPFLSVCWQQSESPARSFLTVHEIVAITRS